MAINPVTLSIRAKKLGVLLRDARLTAGKSIAECAQTIGVSPEAYEDFEFGGKSPSLPELEGLALYLNVPLDHFWGEKAISGTDRQKGRPGSSQKVALRQRLIGARLRQVRQAAGLSLDTLAERSASSPTLLESYELGETPIPLPELEFLCNVLERPIRDFQDRSAQAGANATQPQVVQEFLDLPPELQTFVCKPINRPYLEVARRLSEMSVEKLRAVAEGLLEITL